jgi:GTP-binding protein
MFVDVTKIKVSSGKGGDGIVAFRREKYVPKGGPAGGDGGQGGSVVFVGNEGLSTLIDLKYNKILKANDGENGKPKRMHGKNADDLMVEVPLGTTIYDTETDNVLGDITKHNQKVVICQGGRGGRGNVQFTTSKNTAPEIAEKGEPGLTRFIRVELKVLADVGLVGLPSVGKSTLISVVSNSKPKIAAYHFTTLQPNLGMVKVDDDTSFVMADLPGLIEGASLGQGLGHQFLRHIERTRVILHMVDMGATEGRDPFEDYTKINQELASYKYDLMSRPQIIVANKMDVPGALDQLELFKEQLQEDIPVIPISAVTKENVQQLLYQVKETLLSAPTLRDLQSNEAEDIVEYTFKKKEKPFVITRGDDGIYDVEGETLRRIFEMTDFTKDQSVKRFARQLRQLGVDKALRDEGVKSGDTVRIFGFAFDFTD